MRAEKLWRTERYGPRGARIRRRASATPIELLALSFLTVGFGLYYGLGSRLHVPRNPRSRTTAIFAGHFGSRASRRASRSSVFCDGA